MHLLRPAFILGVCTALLAGCPPKYPKCDKDENCKEGEYCVNGQCQQCRDDKDCGKGKFCNKGRCERKPGYCERNEDCPDGKTCKNNECVPCKADNECGPGGRCRGGRCLRPGQCTSDADCPENYECQNGTCVAPPQAPSAAACTPETIYFEFDQYTLSAEATQRLQAAPKCIGSVKERALRVEGHCDPRGTEEYNLALGDRRAQAVKRYLERLGVQASRLRAVSKGKLEASGTDQASWAHDRKVQFAWE